MPEGSSSLVNEREAEVVLQVYRELRHRHPQLGAKPSVAVISPYKAQVGVSVGCVRLCVCCTGEGGKNVVCVCGGGDGKNRM